MSNVCISEYCSKIIQRMLLYKVKMQYVHLYSIADTSINHTISLQSTPRLKSCIYTCLIIIVDTFSSYERELIACLFLQNFSKGKGNSLQLMCNAHTALLLCGAKWTACHMKTFHTKSLTLSDLYNHKFKNISWQHFPWVTFSSSLINISTLQIWLFQEKSLIKTLSHL